MSAVTDIAWSTTDDDLPELSWSPPPTVHRAPRDGQILTPCCDKVPSELNPDDRLTTDRWAVTCGARARRLAGVGPLPAEQLYAIAARNSTQPLGAVIEIVDSLIDDGVLPARSPAG